MMFATDVEVVISHVNVVNSCEAENAELLILSFASHADCIYS